MNNQEKLTAENLQIIHKKISVYNFADKMILAFLMLMFVFMVIVVEEDFNSLFALIVAVVLLIFYGVARFLLKKQQEDIQKDIINGSKEVFEGFVTKKKIKGRFMSLHINEIEYIVEEKDYNSFEKKDFVKMEILPTSKLVISIIKMEKQ